MVTGGNPDDDVLMSQFIEFVIFFDWMITIGHCTVTLTGLKSQLIFFFSYSRYRLRRGNEKERKDGKRGKKKETKRKKKERKDNSNEKKRGK